MGCFAQYISRSPPSKGRATPAQPLLNKAMAVPSMPQDARNAVISPPGDRATLKKRITNVRLDGTMGCRR